MAAVTLSFNPGSSIVRNAGSVNYISSTGVLAANITGETISGCDKFSGVNILFTIASVVGTSPTFDIYLQQLAPDGTTWYDIAAGPQVSTASSIIVSAISGGPSYFVVTNGTLAASSSNLVEFGGFQRVKVVKGGTNPGGTITVCLEYVE